VVAVVSFYPVFAGYMPGPISGLPRDLASTASFHFASSESALGIPMRAFGELVIGFVMFGAVLQYTGAAHFFRCFGVLLLHRSKVRFQTTLLLLQRMSITCKLLKADSVNRKIDDK
jgi:TRAP-type uncharacterized transport system fused permease subunit